MTFGGGDATRIRTEAAGMLLERPFRLRSGPSGEIGDQPPDLPSTTRQARSLTFPAGQAPGSSVSVGPSGPGREVTLVMTIGQFAQLSGLTPKALRGYDERGLLRPVEVDRATAYRRYAPSQLRRAATIKILRTMGMSMAQVREILDEPDRRAELVERYRAEVAAQHAAQAEAIAHGVATLNAYDQPVAVETRAAPAQPWVGAALAVDLGQVQLERDAQHYNDMFARLAQGLQQADVSIVGPFWTTIRA